jgi:uncharacterized phosphosugar-binding protein
VKPAIPPTLDLCYHARVVELISRLADESAAIERAATAVAESWVRGGRLLVARSHHCLHDELTFRAGGPLAIEVLEEEWEDLPPAGDGFVVIDPAVVQLPNLRSDDVVLVHSNAGVGRHTVSIALLAHELGAVTIALTQLAFETAEEITPWHPSGQRLHEVCDVTVDLGGDIGDAAVTVGPSRVAVAPTSGATGTVAAWMIVARACEKLTERGLTPFVYRGIQLPGAFEVNAELVERWRETGMAHSGTS